MKQIALSIEQMQKLEELGLDTSDASMCWWNFCGNGRWALTPLDDGYELLTIEKMKELHGEETIIPAYTFTDIWKKLPDSIENNGKIFYKWISDSNIIRYSCKDQGSYRGAYLEDFDRETPDNSLLIAAFNILVKLLENDKTRSTTSNT